MMQYNYNCRQMTSFFIVIQNFPRSYYKSSYFPKQLWYSEFITYLISKKFWYFMYKARTYLQNFSVQLRVMWPSQRKNTYYPHGFYTWKSTSHSAYAYGAYGMNPYQNGVYFFAYCRGFFISYNLIGTRCCSFLYLSN